MTLKEVFQTGLTGLFLLLDGLTYWVISKLFSLYSSLAGAEIIKDSFFQEIIDRVYVIIGVSMLFIVAYSLLKALINPDNLAKDTSKLVTNIIISLILLGIVPVIFSYARTLQNIIIRENIISNIFFNNETSNMNIATSGNRIAFELMSAFLNFSDDSVEGSIYNADGTGLATWGEMKSVLLNGNSNNFLNIATFAEPIHEGEGGASYIPILGTLCGIFLAYVILSFCIDLGVRVFKLAFYQLIAPIPILLHILPEKKSVFDNWVKASIATYLEVFIRLFIMVLITEICSSIFDGNIISLNSGGIGTFERVIIILGLFVFAKQAPKLISDAIGVDSGNIKLGIGGKLSSVPAIAGVTGAFTGALGGIWAAGVNHAGIKGILSGMGYGAYKGWKGRGNQFKAQRQGVYSDVLGMEGKSGLFGGRSYWDRLPSDYKKKIQDSYEKKAKNYVSRTENSKEFKKLLNQEKASMEYQYEKLNEQLAKEKAKYDKERLSRIEAMQNDYNKKAKRYDEQRESKLNDLNNKLLKAEEEFDTVKQKQIQEEIDKLKSSQFEDNDLRTQIERLKTEEYHNLQLENEIAKYASLDESTIISNVRKNMGIINERYKANREYVKRRETEKAVKAWREEHAEEAAIQESMLKESFKDMKGVPGGLGSLSGVSSSKGKSDKGSNDKK